MIQRREDKQMTSKPKMFTIAQQKYVYNWLKKKFPDNSISIEAKLDNFTSDNSPRVELSIYVKEEVLKDFGTYEEFLKWKASQS